MLLVAIYKKYLIKYTYIIKQELIKYKNRILDEKSIIFTLPKRY
jgi:hypothetical protein